MTMIRKKTLRLLLYNYQRLTRYYTIYSTFEQWSSDGFTTILLGKLRLLATTIPAGMLRLLLTSIGYRAKARKEKRRQAASGSAPPALSLLLDCPAGWRVPSWPCAL
nr:MAG TPA_asm: major domain protein [Caudoviricetes sp.]